MKMTSAIRALGIASIMSFAFAGAALADAQSMMAGYAACNSAYAQCQQGYDMTLASTPQEGAAKVQANMMHANECVKQYQACWAAVK
jgi:hypothetical protein